MNVTHTINPEQAAELENAIVSQKNEILAQLNAAEDAESLELVYKAVRLVSFVWNAIGYGYKAKEICRRIGEQADNLFRTEETYLSGLRKNDKTRKRTESHMAKLNGLRTLRNS